LISLRMTIIYPIGIYCKQELKSWRQRIIKQRQGGAAAATTIKVLAITATTSLRTAFARSGTPRPRVIDPVCGMTVDPATEAPVASRSDYFSARGCRTKFEANPEKFLAPNHPRLKKNCLKHHLHLSDASEVVR